MSMKRYLHFSGKRRIWPTRIWNLTSKFEAIWGQYGLKPLLFVYFNSNICSNCIFSPQIYQYIENWLYLLFLPLARKMQIQLHRKMFQKFWKYSQKKQQNFRSIHVLPSSVVIIQQKWQQFPKKCKDFLAPPGMFRP